ncbi:UDP-glucose iridoid glucosyltransferase [Dichanthelium oligosanthes]|uniref:UDP-glucose iridoid glucosyltransferase n=1 Tax=Dichanthelium oligosanthes TaxID=888268 RepID=A0A1E5W286_9POAL|nr:UDP-glucose iridoid glucosyltransferase [Dichanthelium oligosanthes]
MAGDGRSPTGRRVVMFPFPFGSHITPMLQLAGLLRARGLAVTVLHADLNAPDPARHPDFTFVSIRESLPDEVVSSPDMVEQMIGLNAACEAPFQAALAELVRGGGPREVACAVVDGQWYKMLGAATRAGVPALALRTDGAATFLTMLATPRLHADGYDRLDELVPGLEPLRLRDLIRVDGSDEETVLRFITRVTDAMRESSSGVVVNTFGAIEGAELAKIKRELSLPAFAVGPLHLVSPAPVGHGRPYAPDRGCLAWLDAQPPRSVLYVSLGSTACVDRAAFVEMAWGLAGSGVPFLWVLRPGSVHGADDVLPFPEELLDTVSCRGKVVGWSPQREVLAHPAVGGFWTHCGWNSIMEGICEGVPMLVQPCFADQTVNARYVTHRWGTGLEIGKVFERTAMARTIRMLMAREQGPQAPKERAHLLKMEASRCVGAGGAASLALDDLVEYMLGL